MNNDMNKETLENIPESAEESMVADNPPATPMPSEDMAAMVTEPDTEEIGLDDDLSFDAEFTDNTPQTTEETLYAQPEEAPVQFEEPASVQTPVYEQPVYAQPPVYYNQPYYYPNNVQAPQVNGYYPPQQPNPPYENTNVYYAPPADGYYTPPADGYYAPPAEEPVKPKRAKGTTALLIVLWVLVGLFALGFFGLCGYIIGTSSELSATEEETLFIPTLFGDEPTTQKPDKDPQIPNSDDTVPLPDKDKDMYSDNVSIELKAFPEDHTNKDKYTTQYAYKAVANSTIGVVCYDTTLSQDPVSQGTGIVISTDGYIATNSHVIGDSRSLYYVQVVTSDGTIYEAKVIGYDSRTDLAVLKINATNLTPATFCDSDYVEVGQDVIAVGNPGGIEFQNSLTKGIVSALDRELSLSSQVSYIQTDAAINPGNSGGPLCNMYGQVIGINTAKISSDSYEGMGFAIPSSTVKEIVDDLISQGYVNDRVRLGISGIPVDSATQQYYNLPAGILIKDVTKDGPCDGADIQTNDILTAIDDDKVTSFSDIYASLAKHKPGDKVVLTVYKLEQNKTIKITVTLMADQGETQQ